VQAHKVPRGIVDRLHDFARHQRGGQCRVGPGRVNKRLNAEILEIVALRYGCRSRSGRDKAADKRQSRKPLEKSASIGHRLAPPALRNLTYRRVHRVTHPGTGVPLSWKSGAFMKLHHLASTLGCDFTGDGEIEISGVAGMEHAGPTELTF